MTKDEYVAQFKAIQDHHWAELAALRDAFYRPIAREFVDARLFKFAAFARAHGVNPQTLGQYVEALLAERGQTWRDYRWGEAA